MWGILVKPVEPGQGAGCHYYFALMGSQFFYCSDGMEGALFKVPIYIYLAPMLHYQQTILGEEMHLLITLWLALWLLIIL